jgi:hypothetical protein
MSEEKTVYDFLMEARKQVGADTLGNLIAGAKSEVAGRLDGTIQPREVEYEWAVLSDERGGLISDTYDNVGEAEGEWIEWLAAGLSKSFVARRPVGEWERVDG